MTNSHRLGRYAAMPFAAAGLLAFIGSGPHQIPSPQAITSEVLDWLGAPIYYRVDPTPNPVNKLVV
jgi:hypothetical protein